MNTRRNGFGFMVAALMAGLAMQGPSYNSPALSKHMYAGRYMQKRAKSSFKQNKRKGL
jgi:hypothetical protein